MKRKGKNRRLKVLILDNDQTYLKMWVRVFKNIKECDCCSTGDPKVATKLLKSHEIDLVISEVILPKVDGYSIAKMAHKLHPHAEVVLTTAYNCDLTRFNIKNPHFSILYKPYNNIDDIQRFIDHLLRHEDVFSDVSEDSFSENEDFPSVMEWKL